MASEASRYKGGLGKANTEVRLFYIFNFLILVLGSKKSNISHIRAGLHVVKLIAFL